MRIHIESITGALFQMKSDLAPTFFSMGNEYKRTLESARKIIDRETRHIEHNHIDISWNRVLSSIRLAIR